VNDDALIQMSAVRVARAAYPRDAVVEEVTWTVRSGDIWVIGGPPAAGKSALLQTAAALNPVLAGELRLFNQPVRLAEHDSFLALRRRVGLVFEGGGRLFEGLSVGGNVALPAAYHFNLELPRAALEVAPLLSACGLTDMADYPVAAISRAWRQRVALARALALRPEVLLLDNPVAGMDPGQFRWWRSFLAQLSAGHPALGGEPVTLIVATDDLRPWLSFGRQFALVHQRSWRVVGTRAELEGSPDEWVQMLLRDE